MEGENPSMPSAPTTHPSCERPLHVLYLGVSGVLHPSMSIYELLRGRTFLDDGHELFECVPFLEALLEDWPSIEIVLTSTRPWKHGLPAVLSELGPSLAARVIGFTFDDLTTKARFGEHQRHVTEMDYWRLGKARIVDMHRHWLRPAHWVAVDDEHYGWSDDELVCQVVVTPPLEGLGNLEARTKLRGLLVHNFGPPINLGEPERRNSSETHGPSERLRRLSRLIYSPEHADRFTVAAAVRAFQHVVLRPHLLVLGLEGTLFTSSGGALVPRPYLYSFLESCHALFRSIAVFHSDSFRATAEELVRGGAAPDWLLNVDCIAWDCLSKDLTRAGVWDVEQALLVDDKAHFVVAGQEKQWVGVTTFDGSQRDSELIRVYEVLEQALGGGK